MAFTGVIYAAMGGNGNALLTATPVLAKTGPIKIQGWRFQNSGGFNAYVQCFDVSLANQVTLGTTVPMDSVLIYAGTTYDYFFRNDLTFHNGLVLAATTTSTGNTAPVTGINAVIF